jgi:hypothetical protein
MIDGPVSLADLKLMAQGGFGNLVKAVVDVEREIMAVDGELHADEEALLLETKLEAERVGEYWIDYPFNRSVAWRPLSSEPGCQR